jgi:hypothetical protein
VSKAHRHHEGYVPFSEQWRWSTWLDRATRNTATQGESKFIWSWLRRWDVVQMIEGKQDGSRRKLGYYRFNPVLQQAAFDVKEIATSVEAICSQIKKER